MRGLLKGAPPAEKSSPTATPIVDLFIIRSLLRVSGREGPETNERTNGVNLHVLMKSKLKHRNKNSRDETRTVFPIPGTCIVPFPRVCSRLPASTLASCSFSSGRPERRVGKLMSERLARAKPRLVIKIVLPMLLLPIKIVLLLATPINALRIHPFAVPSCAPQSARAALVVMRWDPKKDPIEDPVPFEVRDGRVPEYKPPAPEYQPPEDGCEIVCYHPRRCLRFRCDRLAPLL